jgi:hypothetical protein
LVIAIPRIQMSSLAMMSAFAFVVENVTECECEWNF